MAEFNWMTGLAGGTMIGVAAALLMLVNGRIAGISGIVDGVLAPMREGFSWKFAFMAGLIAAPLVYWAAVGARATIAFPHPLWMIALGGFFVGFGTRIGSGCTSGHGVCGLARLSKRSLAATATFMGVAIVTVFVIRIASGA